jgi:hypothetical protein
VEPWQSAALGVFCGSHAHGDPWAARVRGVVVFGENSWKRLLDVIDKEAGGCTYATRHRIAAAVLDYLYE